VDEPRKGLVVARETGRRAATGDILVYLDADCRAPLTWLERVERRFLKAPALIALSGPYRYYDWDWWGRPDRQVRRHRDHRPYFDEEISAGAGRADRTLGRRAFGVRDSHIIALGLKKYISADQSADAVLREIRRQGALSIACHPHHTTARRIEISTCYLWDHREELSDLVDVWDAAQQRRYRHHAVS
jgi:glycosyltransferase involved in cell wall biosynthesis